MIVHSLDYGKNLVVVSRNDIHGIKVHHQIDNVQLFLHYDKVIEVSDKAIIVRGLEEYLLQL